MVNNRYEFSIPNPLEKFINLLQEYTFCSHVIFLPFGSLNDKISLLSIWNKYKIVSTGYHKLKISSLYHIPKINMDFLDSLTAILGFFWLLNEKIQLGKQIFRFSTPKNVFVDFSLKIRLTSWISTYPENGPSL